MRSHWAVRCVALLILVSAPVVWRQELPSAKPEDVGLSAEKLARVGSAVQALVDEQKVAGAITIAFGPLQRPGVGFGLGFSVQVSRDPFSASRVGEYGWGGAASTHFWISPKDELVVIALQQFMPFSTRLEQTIKPLVYDAIVD